MLISRGVRLERNHRQPFTTIDDCLPLARRLAARLGEGSEPTERLKVLADQLAIRLTKLAEQKHPLDVRRGVVREERKEVESVRDSRESRQIKAGSRTYFVDIETAKGESGRYLRITESRFHGEGKERERSSIIVFPEHVQEFVKAVSEMMAKLG